MIIVLKLNSNIELTDYDFCNLTNLIYLIYLRNIRGKQCLHQDKEHSDRQKVPKRVACLCFFLRIRLRPRILRDVSVSDTRTTIQGTEISFPVGIAPTAFHCLAWHEGEMATARGENRSSREWISMLKQPTQTDDKNSLSRHLRSHGSAQHLLHHQHLLHLLRGGDRSRRTKRLPLVPAVFVPGPQAVGADRAPRGGPRLQGAGADGGRALHRQAPQRHPQPVQVAATPEGEEL